MDTTNAVRQILMNELGLTRESVRTMVEDIVKETLDRKIETMIAEGYLQKMVDQSINKVCANSQWDTAAIQTIISKAAGTAIQEKMFQDLCRG